jgi:hypothetical protein
LIAAGLLAVACFAGVAAPVVAQDMSALEARARAWWSARQAADERGMYELFEPSFRAGTSFDAFRVHTRRLTRIPLEDLRIKSITPAPDSRRAVVRFVAKSKLARSGEVVDVNFEDQWVFEQGEWWRVYVSPKGPFG